MSEKIVVFRANQELQADDLNNMQAWLQQGVDHVVLDSIIGGKAYSGFTISKGSSTQVNVSAGRLYDTGAVYAQESVTALDLYNDLPVATKRYYAIVAWGTTVDEDIQPRNYLVDADEGDAEPQSNAMRSTRYANLNYVKGTESADPQYPNVAATVLLIGYVLCTPQGIESVSQSTDNKIDNLALVEARTTVLEAWRAILAGLVDTLRTDLGNLARQMLLYTPISLFQELSNIVADQSRRIGVMEKSIELISGLFLFQGRDCFLDDSLTDETTLDAVPYAAQINEGLRFPGGSVDSSGKLELLNESNPLITTADGMLLPKPSGSRVRYDCSFPGHEWIEHRILAHATYWSFTAHHLRPSRWRHRCGPHYGPCAPSQVWWHESQRDPAGHILSFTSESWENVWSDVQNHNEWDIHWPRHASDRFKYHWRDWVSIPYWDKVYTDYNHSGNHMAHSFFNAQDGWLTSITLFMLNTTWGALDVLITGCDEEGVPDHGNHTLRRVVLDASGLEACKGTPIYAGDIDAEIVVAEYQGHGEYDYDRIYREVPVYVTPVRIPIPPVFLRGGQRYAFHLNSTFDHKFCVSDRDECYQVHQGHLWHGNGSRLTAWLSSPRSLRFKLHFATWGRWGDQSSPGGQLRYEIDLQPLLLAGGIGSVDVLAESVIPEACTLNYAVQVGGVWRAFAGDPDTPSFSGAPTQLPFRLVMTGTTDLMPAVSLDNSQITLTSAVAAAFHHYTSEFTCPSSSCIKVVVNMLNFVEANHELDCAVHYNGSTHHAADAEADKVEADGSITRTFTHNVTTATTFKAELHGTTNHTGDEPIITKAEFYSKAT